MTSYSELWAKYTDGQEPYPLLAHLLDSAAIGRVLFEEWLRPGLQSIIREQLGPQAKSIVQAVVGFHDIGKASPFFQERRNENDEKWGVIQDRIRSSGNFNELDPGSVLFSREPKFVRRHEQWSAYALKQGFLSSRDFVTDQWESLVAIAHHGKFSIPGTTKARVLASVQGDLRSSGYSQAQQDLIGLILEACGLVRDQLPKSVSSTVTILLSGLTILADRIASGEPFVDSGLRKLEEDPNLLNNPSDWLEWRRAEAHARVRATVGIYQSWGNESESISAILGDYSPNQIQQLALESGGGMWSLMAPTGGGKTEASLLRHSQCAERLIFLLPTRATANAIMKRIQKAFQNTTNVAALAHGLASVEDFYNLPLSIHDDKIDAESIVAQEPEGLYPSSFVRSGVGRLFAPVVVGTIDQALIAALPGKWLHFILLGLANSHIVIDEVHAMDHYQSKLLETLLPWLSSVGTRVTMLTATMPSWQRQMLLTSYSRQPSLELGETRFPSVEHVTKGRVRTQEFDMEHRDLNVELRFANPDDLIDLHLQWHEERRQRFPQGRIGIICNTVKRAQLVAQELVNRGERVLVLHSRMSAEHRREVTDQLLTETGPKGEGVGLTVVGTQAIEASLDIDLDLLNTELCPAPSLIQRAGRQWRRPDPNRAQRVPGMNRQLLTVTWFDAELTGEDVEEDEAEARAKSGRALPYFASEMHRTLNWLKGRETIHFPRDAQEFVDEATINFETASTINDFDALATQALYRLAADVRRAPIETALHPDASVADLVALTDDLATDERVTRLEVGEDRRRITIILGGDPSVVPGAWMANLMDLERVTAADRETIRSALRGSIPVPLTEKEFTILTTEGLEPIKKTKTILRNYYFLPHAERFYDETFGWSLGLEDSGADSRGVFR